MNKKRLLVVVLSVATMCASAQKFKPSPDFLKGEKQINVVFDYSQVKYDKDLQSKYYKEKGTKWVEEWEGKRRDNNANSFIKDVNGELSKLKVNVDVSPEAEYTLIVCVLNCDFGAYAGPMSVPAKLQCTINVVKTGTTTVLASTTLKVTQNPYTAIATPVDFDRMYLAFGEIGENVGEILYKILKK